VSATSRVAPAFWDEWTAVTRFLESARIAFSREVSLWNGLQLTTPDEDLVLCVKSGQRSFSLAIDVHVKVLSDPTILYSTALLHSYALTESAASKHLNIDPREFGGIEDWGNKLLENASRDWPDVFGGKAGAVEVAVVRNAFAHGTRRVDSQGSRRLDLTGAPSRRVGGSVSLGYEEVGEFRDRLRSLLRVAGVGVKSRSTS
jgi:hypothetical protein